MTNPELNTKLNSKLAVFLLYSLGQLGWSLTSFGVLNLLTYFYLPPQEGGEAIFPPYIFQGAILGALTLIGIIASGGRFFDAFTDPLIANLSDRSTSGLGYCYCSAFLLFYDLVCGTLYCPNCGTWKNC
jgi:Na+/melibiose symporter-like transporter